LSHGSSTEVQEQADPQIQQTQIREKLLRVNVCELLYRLHLDDNAAIDEEIGAESVLELHVIINDTHRQLALYTETPPLEGGREHEHVHRLEQAWAELAMDRDRRCYHSFCDVVRLHVIFSAVPPLVS